MAGGVAHLVDGLRRTRDGGHRLLPNASAVLLLSLPLGTTAAEIGRYSFLVVAAAGLIVARRCPTPVASPPDPSRRGSRLLGVALVIVLAGLALRAASGLTTDAEASLRMMANLALMAAVVLCFDVSALRRNFRWFALLAGGALLFSVVDSRLGTAFRSQGLWGGATKHAVFLAMLFPVVAWVGVWAVSATRGLSTRVWRVAGLIFVGLYLADLASNGSRVLLLAIPSAAVLFTFLEVRSRTRALLTAAVVGAVTTFALAGSLTRLLALGGLWLPGDPVHSLRVVRSSRGMVLEVFDSAGRPSPGVLVSIRCKQPPASPSGWTLGPDRSERAVTDAHGRISVPWRRSEPAYGVIDLLDQGFHQRYHLTCDGNAPSLRPVFARVRADTGPEGLASHWPRLQLCLADEARSVLWAATLDLIVQRPILGWGPGGWRRAFFDPEAHPTLPFDLVLLDGSAGHPHSNVLLMAAEYGVPLVLAGLLLVVGSLLRIVTAQRATDPTERRPEASLIAVALTALCLCGLVDTLVLGMPEEVLWWTLVGLAARIAVTGETLPA